MTMSNSSDEFYSKLKTKLQETSSWPSKYLFKFIVKSDPVKISDIESIFNNMGSVITSTPSKKGTYTSVSIHVDMENPEAVIEKYKQVGQSVNDVISL
jgi:putative lipoic acid-binding regulatory protein